MVEEEEVESADGACSGGKGSLGGELMIATKGQGVRVEVVRGKIQKEIRMSGSAVRLKAFLNSAEISKLCQAWGKLWLSSYQVIRIV